MKSTIQLPRPEVADLLSLGVLPDSGEQTGRMAERLQAIVESTPSYREASRRRLARGFPMGDGVVLAFFEEDDLALSVAIEVARAWRLDPALADFGVRMGLVSVVLPREAATVSDARMGNPGLQRAREVMRMAKADQILLPMERMDSLRRLSGTAKGLVLLGERLLSDQSRIQLCAWFFRPHVVEPGDADYRADHKSGPKVDDAFDYRTGNQAVNISPLAPLLSPPEVPAPEVPAPVNTSPLAPRASSESAYLREVLVSAPLEHEFASEPEAEPEPDLTPAPAAVVFTPASGGAAEIVWADSQDAVEPSGEGATEEQRSGRGKLLLILFLLVVIAAIAAIWRPWETPADTAKDALPAIQMDFVRIPAGIFTMGANDRERDERPAHEVRLTQDFEIGKYEVTQAQWKLVMDGANPSRLQSDDLPVTNISWLDATRFAERLTVRMNDRYLYRLPTEAEWEYGARAGIAGQEAEGLETLALFGQSDGGPRAVGRGSANVWVIFDMFGNVFEWCQDNYSARTYEGGARENPSGPTQADADTGRIIRGGGWRSKADKCRPGYRGYIPPDKSNDETGLRVVRVRR